MKVLFIDTRRGGDWGMDLLYSGLCRNLDVENVIDFPAQYKHRMGKPVLVGDPEKDWGAERMSLSYHPNYDKAKEYTKDEIVNMIRTKQFDCVFIDERHESYEAYMSLRLNIFDIPVIVVAGHDRFWNQSPEWVRQNYYGKNLKLMFLDNWRKEYKQLPYARPYNWSINFDHLWDYTKREEYLQNKVYDICFMGYNSHPDRLKYINFINEKFGHLNNHIVLETKPNSFDSFVPKEEYFKNICQSKIVLNLRGAAENGKAMRLFETLYCGSFLLTQNIDEQDLGIDDDYHFLQFNNEEELFTLLSWLTKDNAEVNRKAFAKNGYIHGKEHLGVKNVVELMLDEIKNA